MQRVTITGAVVSGQEVRVQGYYSASGDWRPIAVNASGELPISVSVTATANISGQAVWVSSGEVVAQISGQPVSISGQPVQATVTVSEVSVSSGEIHVISGEIIVTSTANPPNIDIPLSTVARTRVYEQTFEDGTTDTTVNNATQTVQSTEVYAGNYALQVTIAAGNTGYVETPTRPVSPYQQVTFTFAHKEDANITDLKLITVWYSANMREISTDEFTLTPSTSWRSDSRTLAAPKNTAYMALRMQATAGTSDGNVYLDDMFIDLVGQILRVDGEGQVKVTDTALLEEIQAGITAYISGQSVWISSGEVITKPLEDVVVGSLVDIPSTSGGITLGTQTIDSLTIKALSRNSGDIYIGGNKTGSMPYSGFGLLLEPGEAINLDIHNLNAIRVYAAVSGDKVTYLGLR